MPIELSCKCGRELNLRDELAGKTVRCPKCSGNVQVPLPASEVVEVVEEFAEGAPPPVPKRKNSIDVAPPPRVEKIKEPKKKKKKQSVYAQRYGGEKEGTVVAFNEGWFGSMAGGIIGGSITFLVGAGILTTMLLLGFIGRGLIFAIVLMVAGMIAILKGLMDLY